MSEVPLYQHCRHIKPPRSTPTWDFSPEDKPRVGEGVGDLHKAPPLRQCGRKTWRLEVDGAPPPIASLCRSRRTGRGLDHYYQHCRHVKSLRTAPTWGVSPEDKPHVGLGLGDHDTHQVAVGSNSTTKRSWAGPRGPYCRMHEPTRHSRDASPPRQSLSTT
jgi:hypothetical protein